MYAYLKVNSTFDTQVILGVANVYVDGVAVLEAMYK